MTKSPKPEPLHPEVIAHLSRIGKRGGSSTSPAKRAAAKRNADKAWRARWRKHAGKWKS